MVVQDGHQSLLLHIVPAEFLVSLSERVKLHRSSSHLVRVAKGGLKDGDKSFHIVKVHFIREDIRLNLVLCIALQKAIYVAEFVLIIDVA
jgi:hypothetical protein